VIFYKIFTKICKKKNDAVWFGERRITTAAHGFNNDNSLGWP